MQNIWKKNAKLMLILLLDIFIISGATYAATTMYQSNTVGYDNTTSGLNSNNVQGALDEVYSAATNYTSVNSRLTALENNYLSNVYPVGSIYIGVSNTNPGTLFGGTWVSFGEGRTIIGVGTGTDSNSTSKTFAINETAGEYNHTLTSNESGQKNLGTVNTSSTTPSLSFQYGYSSGTTCAYITCASGNDYNGNANTIWSSLTHKHTVTISGSSASSAHNNIQPYITVYMWKRTA